MSPDSEYPNKEHPLDYFFDNKGYRTLDEFQLVLIAQGSYDQNRGHAPSDLI